MQYCSRDSNRIHCSTAVGMLIGYSAVLYPTNIAQSAHGTIELSQCKYYTVNAAIMPAATIQVERIMSGKSCCFMILLKRI